MEELFIGLDSEAFKKFIERTLEKHGLKVNSQDLMSMLIEALVDKAKQDNAHNSYSAIYMEDETLETAIIKASTHLENWKNSKKNTKLEKISEDKVKVTKKKKEEESFNFTELKLF